MNKILLYSNKKESTGPFRAVFTYSLPNSSISYITSINGTQYQQTTGTSGSIIFEPLYVGDVIGIRCNIVFYSASFEEWDPTEFKRVDPISSKDNDALQLIKGSDNMQIS